MFLSEYSSICACGSCPSSKVANMRRSRAISVASARCVASRADIPSSAAHTVTISMISRLDLRTTNAPRRGTMRTKPSCSRRHSASRTGVRLTPSFSESWRSSRRSSSVLA